MQNRKMCSSALKDSSDGGNDLRPPTAPCVRVCIPQANQLLLVASCCLAEPSIPGHSHMRLLFAPRAFPTEALVGLHIRLPSGFTLPPCLRLTVPATERIMDFPQSIAHAGRTKKGRQSFYALSAKNYCFYFSIAGCVVPVITSRKGCNATIFNMR